MERYRGRPKANNARQIVRSAGAKKLGGLESKLSQVNQVVVGACASWLEVLGDGSVCGSWLEVAGDGEGSRSW